MWKQRRECLEKLLGNCIQKKSHKAGKLVHAQILRTGFASHTFFSNRLIDLYSKCDNPKYALRVFDVMLQRDLFSWNSALTALCEFNRLTAACQLFDQMPERDVVSWNNMIRAFVRDANYAQALEKFKFMISDGFVPTHFTLATIFSVCGALLDVFYGKLCHGIATKVGADQNIYAANSLLSMYAKCSCIDDAICIFQHLPSPNQVSFTALISGFKETCKVEELLRVFRLMHKTLSTVDAMSLSSILGVCTGGMGDGFQHYVCGKLVHALSIKLGFYNDFHLVNSLLEMYAKNGDMGSAEITFQSMSKPSVVSWNIMIGGYGGIYKFERAKELLEMMVFSGCQPDEVTFINMIKACTKSGNVNIGRQLFNKLLCPTLSLWNAMFSGYSQVGKHEEAIMLFREMQFRNVKPDNTTLAIVLASCAEIPLLECGKQVHAVTIKAASNNDMYVGSGLISLYSRSGEMEYARSVFLGLPTVDIVCWNSILAGFSFNSLEEEAFDFFNGMRRSNMCPTNFSYAIMLSCCAKQSFSSQGGQIHALILKDGCLSDVVVGSALIDMYCKCGNVEVAQEIFFAMPLKNVIVWNEMIHGLAQNGFGDEAVHLFNFMIGEGEKPDDITFIAVLTACSHSGLVDYGVHLLESMLIEHKVEPILDHYICIIDALGRAGRLREAEMLIRRMPCKDDPVIWEILLSSCRFYSDISVARRAAEQLFSMDPTNSTPYVLLANVLSSLERWDEVRAVREQMCDNNMGKNVGYSWTLSM